MQPTPPPPTPTLSDTVFRQVLSQARGLTDRAKQLGTDPPTQHQQQLIPFDGGKMDRLREAKGCLIQAGEQLRMVGASKSHRLTEAQMGLLKAQLKETVIYTERVVQLIRAEESIPRTLAQTPAAVADASDLEQRLQRLRGQAVGGTPVGQPHFERPPPPIPHDELAARFSKLGGPPVDSSAPMAPVPEAPAAPAPGPEDQKSAQQPKVDPLPPPFVAAQPRRGKFNYADSMENLVPKGPSEDAEVQPQVPPSERNEEGIDSAEAQVAASHHIAAAREDSLALSVSPCASAGPKAEVNATGKCPPTSAAHTRSALDHAPESFEENEPSVQEAKRRMSEERCLNSLPPEVFYSTPTDEASGSVRGGPRAPEVAALPSAGASSSEEDHDTALLIRKPEKSLVGTDIEDFTGKLRMDPRFGSVNGGQEVSLDIGGEQCLMVLVDNKPCAQLQGGQLAVPAASSAGVVDVLVLRPPPLTAYRIKRGFEYWAPAHIKEVRGDLPAPVSGGQVISIATTVFGSEVVYAEIGGEPARIVRQNAVVGGCSVDVEIPSVERTMAGGVTLPSPSSILLRAANGNEALEKDVVTWKLPRVFDNSLKGDRVTLLADRTVARRNNGVSHGLAFTKYPLSQGYFEVCIAETDVSMKTLAIGVTLSTREAGRIPETGEMVPMYLLVGYDPPKIVTTSILPETVNISDRVPFTQETPIDMRVWRPARDLKKENTLAISVQKTQPPPPTDSGQPMTPRRRAKGRPPTKPQPAVDPREDGKFEVMLLQNGVVRIKEEVFWGAAVGMSDVMDRLVGVVDIMGKVKAVELIATEPPAAPDEESFHKMPDER